MDAQCSKCGAKKAFPADRFRQHGEPGGIIVSQYEHPAAMLLKGRTADGVITALVCGACGYTELKTSNAAALYEVYRLAQLSQ